MKNRRNFIKTGMAAAVVAVASGNIFARDNKPGDEINLPGLIYTEKYQGMWKNKAESHLPKIKIDGDNITLTTDHGMSEAHYIVRHTLVDKSGKVIGSNTFAPADTPVSVFAIPQAYSGKLYATSFCNKHDFWVNEFEV